MDLGKLSELIKTHGLSMVLNLLLLTWAWQTTAAQEQRSEALAIYVRETLVVQLTASTQALQSSTAASAIMAQSVEQNTAVIQKLVDRLDDRRAQGGN
jgi:hypothetical protein